jgi:iron(III) transport system permease protein
MNRHPDRPVRLWLLAGLMAYLILPWYAIQDTAWYTMLGQVLGGPETASGLVQILAHHRVWLLLGVLGLVVAAIGLAVPPGKAQGRWFLAGGGIGLRRTAGQRLHDRRQRLVVRDPQQGVR